jgi:hypothetical protein
MENKETSAFGAMPETEKEEQNSHDAGGLGLAPASQEPEPIRKPVPVEGTGDSRDTNKVDSLGNPKGDQVSGEEHDQVSGTGPRGANVSPEHLPEARRAESAQTEERRLQHGMSSTDDVDSIGNDQGAFRVEPQGLDKHGARIPDKVTDELVEEQPAQIGPRGANAPPETFHGKRK